MGRMAGAARSLSCAGRSLATGGPATSTTETSSAINRQDRDGLYAAQAKSTLVELAHMVRRHRSNRCACGMHHHRRGTTSADSCAHHYSLSFPHGTKGGFVEGTNDLPIVRL